MKSNKTFILSALFAVVLFGTVALGLNSVSSSTSSMHNFSRAVSSETAFVSNHSVNWLVETIFYSVLRNLSN